MLRQATEQLPMPTAYFRLFLREYGQTEEMRAAVLAGTGITTADLAAPGAEITLGQQLQQFENLRRLLPPGWMLQPASNFHVSTHGPLGFAMVTAPTLGASLSVMERFGHVRAPYFRSRGRRDPRAYALVVESRVAFSDEERLPLVEAWMLSGQSLVESVLGRPMTGARITFACPPPSYAARYADYFRAHLLFDCAETAFIIPTDWLALECPLADAAAHAASLRQLEGLARCLDGDSFLVARVEQVLAQAEDTRVSEATVAAHLRVSRRTLNRRLGEAGTTYRALLEARQRERAERLFREAGLSIAEIGYRLGYSDPANFGRACRRWFGEAPTAFRARLLGGT